MLSNLNVHVHVGLFFDLSSHLFFVLIPLGTKMVVSSFGMFEMVSIVCGSHDKHVT